MNQPSVLKKPSRLDQARVRLDSALANLESALLNNVNSGSSGDGDHLALRLEQENAVLKARNQILSDLNQRIVGRLDGIIARLKRAEKS